MGQKFNAIKINAMDNVAVALDNIKAGELLSIQDQTDEIKVVQDIPYGHKIAITAISNDGRILKYGECMGMATEDIPVGHHVHVSNVRGLTEEDKADTISGKAGATR